MLMIIKFKFLFILISAFIKVGQKQVGDKEVKWQDVFAWSRSKTTFLAPNTPGGVLPYMGYIGMCRCGGYGFQAVYSRTCSVYKSESLGLE